MAEENLQVVRLKQDFYRDGLNKVIFALITIGAAIGLLIALTVYFYLTKPPPTTFSSDSEWRILSPVPLDQPYLPVADLVQWVGETVPQLFTFDFVNYARQYKNLEQYFTSKGWQTYLTAVNPYVHASRIQSQKLFVGASLSNAPIISNQGLLEGRYGWWVTMPITISYTSGNKTSTQDIALEVLVIRVSTLNNLYGVAIENFIVK